MCISNAKISNLKVWYIIAYLLLYAILRRTLNTKENVLEISKKIYYLIFIIASLNAVIAILQKTQLLSCSNNYFQVTGLFFSPNHMGLFLVIGILSLIELIKENKSQLNKILFLSFFVILAYSLYLSKCRGAYLALIIAILCNMINSRKENKKTFFYKKTLYALLILSTLITMLWSTNRFKSESVSGRFFIIKQSLMELANRPFTGYGFDSFSLQYNLAKADYFAIERSWEETRNAGYIYNANNDFLELSFELGMIWIVVFFIFIIMLLSKANKSNTSKASSSMLLCIIIFAFTNTIQSIPLLVVLGCIFTVSIINESETKKIILFKQTNLFKIIAIISLITFSTIIVLRLNAEYRLRKIYNAEEISSVQKTENFISKIDANGEQLFMAGIICIKSNNQEKGFRYLINGFKLSGKPSLGKNLARIFESMGIMLKQRKFTFTIEM